MVSFAVRGNETEIRDGTSLRALHGSSCDVRTVIAWVPEESVD